MSFIVLGLTGAMDMLLHNLEQKTPKPPVDVLFPKTIVACNSIA